MPSHIEQMEMERVEVSVSRRAACMDPVKALRGE
jgi:hypothetical protein